MPLKQDSCSKVYIYPQRTNPGSHLHSTHCFQVVIDISSFQLKSAHYKIKKNISRPNCFTIAKILCKDFFQYAEVPFVVFIKVNASSEAMNYCTASLRFLLNTPTGKFVVTIFVKAMLIYVNVSFHLLQTECTKNM